MALKGDLSTIDLSHVFQMLTLSERAGTLEIDAEGRRSSLYFTGSGILLPFDRDAFPERVVWALVRSGVIDAQALEDVRAEVRSVGHALLERLHSMDLLDPADTEDAYRQQMEEEVCDLFVIRDGTFEYLEGQRPKLGRQVLDEQYTLPVQSVLMEAARRMDEWARFHQMVPSETCVFEVAAELEHIVGDEDPIATEEVFSQLDGRLSVGELIGQIRLSRYQVYRSLSLLAEQRLIFEIANAALIEESRRRIDEGRFDEGLQALERALDRGADDMDVLELAAEASEKAGRSGRAGELLGLIAGRDLASGDRGAAIEGWLRIRRLLPTHVEVREQLFEAYLEDPKQFPIKRWNPLQECAQLATILSCIGRRSEAADCLMRYHESCAGELRTVQELARVAAELGAPKVAVELMESAAVALSEQGQHGPALTLYRRIRSIDPSRSGLSKAIQICERGAQREAPRRRQFLRVALVLVGFGGGSGLWWKYDAAAFEEYSEVGVEVMALEGDFQRARDRLEQFRQEHPVSVASFLASRKLSEIDERDREHQERVRNLAAHETKRLQRALERADRVHEEALELIRSGDYVQGLALLEKLKDIGVGPQWLAERKVSSRSNELREYLAQSEAVFQTWRDGSEAGDWEKAHAAALELRRRFPASPHSARVDLPVLIEVRPVGAEVVIQRKSATTESARMARAPALLQLRPGSRYEVEVRAEGYRSQNFSLEPEAGASRRVSLIREVAVEGRLPVGILGTPVAIEGGWVATGEQGYLIRWDSKLGTIAWDAQLSDLEEFVGPPTLFRDLVIAAGQRRLHLFDLATGVARGSTVLSETATGSASVCRGVVAVCLGSSPGKTQLRAWDLPALQPRWQGPERNDPVLHAACSDGFVVAEELRVVRIDGRTGDEIGRCALRSPPTALAVAADVIWVGMQNGSVVRWDLGDDSRKGIVLGQTAVQSLQVHPDGALAAVGREVCVLSSAGSKLGHFQRECEDGPMLWFGPQRMLVEWSEGLMRWVDADGRDLGEETFFLEQRPQSLLRLSDGVQALGIEDGVLYLRQKDAGRVNSPGTSSDDESSGDRARRIP